MLEFIYTLGLAPVAQGIERRFPKPCVGCSNHLGGAINKSLETTEIIRVQGFLIVLLVVLMYC